VLEVLDLVVEDVLLEVLDLVVEDVLL